MPYGQIVVGPPGAGKSTYCTGLQLFFKATGRKSVVFNMDPANESLPYAAAVSIRDLVKAEDVAAEHKLGPNGSLLFCMEVLEKNFAWLHARMKEHRASYIVFDFPGQVELYTHNDCIRSIVQHMVALDYRIACINLVDSHYCTDPAKFISVLLMSLTVIIKLEIPAINVLSKIDLIEQYGELPFSLEYFMECADLGHLAESLNADPLLAKYAKLNHVMCELVEDFPFVGYHTLDIQNRESVMRVTKAVDKANGYSIANFDMSKATYSALVGTPDRDSQYVGDVEERYVKSRR
jgi:GPN-loop GTPase